ncbi:MAG TPA: PASTA domain-containing protein [Thermoanaerobaculia bacterium]|nr:PASTA domain-containing protein [Thermoanaerobaculia bacterium]
MRRILFRFLFGGVLVAVFAIFGWLSFEKSVLGRSILVPNLIGRDLDQAAKIARDAGLDLKAEQGRDRFDEKVPAHAVLLQSPSVGSFVKPGQTVRVVLSLGPRSIRVPDLTGLSPRAASLSLSRASLTLGAVSTDRETQAAGITSQSPAPDSPAGDATPVGVLVNRGAPDRLFVMPDLVGHDAEHEKERLTTLGFKVGAIHYEEYEGLAPDTILKQYPPAGYPCSPRDPVTFTAARATRP